LDRIDIHIEVPSVKYKDLSDEVSGEKSEVIRSRVMQAKEIQLARFKDDGIFANSQMSHKLARRQYNIGAWIGICGCNLTNPTWLK